MQNNTQYTRCPQCETAFKVTEKMLSMAHGKVRCGACLEVFMATEHLLQPRGKKVNPVAPATDNLAQTTEEDPAPVPSQLPENEPRIGNIDDVTAEINEPFSASQPDFDDSIEEEGAAEVDEDEEELVALESESLGLSTADDFNDDALAEQMSGMSAVATEPENKGGLETTTDVDENFTEDPPLSFADESLNETAEAAETIDSADLDGLTSEPFEQDIEESIAMGHEPEEFDTEPFIEPDVPAEPLIQEDGEIDAELDTELDTIELQLEMQQAEQDAEELLAEEQPLNDPDISEFDSEQLALEEQETLDQLSQTLTDQISDTDTEPDPLDEFEDRVEKKKTSLRTLVVAATAVTLLSVLSVNFWNNRQTLAWDDTWGGFTHTVCAVLPCDIQPQRDISKIRLRQRIVTPSESQENQLDVKILLTNEAAFDQPYPKIIIKFSNSLGEQVAVKHFEVAEYFPAKQNELMPAGSEIHIAFTSEQPHPDALGFEFSFQ